MRGASSLQEDIGSPNAVCLRCDPQQSQSLLYPYPLIPDFAGQVSVNPCSIDDLSHNMSKLLPIPRFDHHLSTFVADLRSSLFGSQGQAAQYFQLSAGTISRYESGKRSPVIGYVASLAILFVEQLDEQFDSGKQALLLSLNSAIRRSDCYAQESPFANWEALCAVASAYMRERQGAVMGSDSPSRKTVTDWGEAPDVSLFYGRESELATLGTVIKSIS